MTPASDGSPRRADRTALRFLALGELTAQLIAVRLRVHGVPSPEQLAPLQRSADRMAGLPGLVAACLAGYTGVPLDDPATLAGRASRPVPGGGWRSRPTPDRHLSVDRRLVLGLLHGFRLGDARLGFVHGVLRELDLDVERNRDPGAVESTARSLLATLGARGVDGSLAAPATDTLDLRLDVPTDGPVEVLQLLRFGVCHGRLGATGRTEDPFAAPGWETARRAPAASVEVIELLMAFVGGRTALDELVAAAAALGVPPGPFRSNLGRLRHALEPVLPAWRSDGPLGPEPPRALPVVPERLGLLYLLGDLLALAHRADLVTGTG